MSGTSVIIPESTAVKEFCKRNGDSYEMISVKNSIQPSLVLKKFKS